MISLLHWVWLKIKRHKMPSATGKGHRPMYTEQQFEFKQCS